MSSFFLCLLSLFAAMLGALGGNDDTSQFLQGLSSSTRLEKETLAGDAGNITNQEAEEEDLQWKSQLTAAGSEGPQLCYCISKCMRCRSCAKCAGRLQLNSCRSCRPCKSCEPCARFLR
eukprot:TRINITY_DN2491_c0_g1_i2.p1 TRINITY_DN2491_c0_g1~~TRINITY_DN2491_c0_g1_i2.p1  ORF type:complete len:119 (-),score=12.85 TRINITY_DN2491_c0_g1_i2:300-656(-)